MDERHRRVSEADRFSTRAPSYDLGRPSYPGALFEHYREVFSLGPGRVVADVGAGTGIHAGQLRALSVSVVAVEPNPRMRDRATARFDGDSGVRVVAGSAEATGLGDSSVDLVVAAQAFHWFDPDAFREECQRILRRPHAWALVWNIRNPRRNRFTEGYEAVLHRYGKGYGAIRDSWGAEEAVARFAGDSSTRRRTFPNDRSLDAEALEALLDSSSYMPLPGDPSHDEVRREVEELVRLHGRKGSVTMAYDTVVITSGSV